jgi:DNA-binding response OmpR family regulator
MTITEAVLFLVEDEFLIQEMVNEALTEAGFKIETASSGTKAIKQLGDDAARFRAVITDIQLGEGPDGWDVAKRARELVHNMPIVYMSGCSEQDWTSKGVPNSVMLGKPFAPAQIVTAVSMLINQADTR